MTDSQRLNSTDRLLASIREGYIPPGPPRPLGSDLPRTGKTHPLSQNIKHGLCLGVHICSRTLFLVLTGEWKKGAAKKIVKWEAIGFPEDIDPDNLGRADHKFSMFLRSCLHAFLGKKRSIPVWASINTKHLKLRNIIIPGIHASKMGNAAMWGLKKETDLEIEREIFDYTFVEDTQVEGVKKKRVVAFAGEKKNIKSLKALFVSAGYPLTGISAMPFALQNFWATGQVNAPMPVIIANIRRHRSEIHCISEQGVMVARSIKTGAFTLMETVSESMDSETVDNLDVPVFLSKQQDRNAMDFEPMQAPASRLLGKIQRTGEYCSNIYLANKPILMYHFFGETDNCQAFMAYADELMPGRTCLLLSGGDTSLEDNISMPREAALRSGLIPALGLALSDNAHTANFLYTYRQKEIMARARKTNALAVVACIAVLAACLGVWVWCSRVENRQIQQCNALKNSLARLAPAVTPQNLAETIAGARNRSAMAVRYADRYIGLAVINEIATLTPEHISLTAVQASLAATVKRNGPENTNDGSPSQGGNKKQTIKDQVMIQGVVSAAPSFLEPTLTGFMLALKNSPLFRQVEIREKRFDPTGDARTLWFSAHMEIR